MNETLYIIILIVVCITLYFLCKTYYYNPMFIEGMTTNFLTSKLKLTDDGISADSSVGVAGNAASYAASIKAASIKLQDVLLINKYKSDYESAIINLDDLINNLMLNTALNVNESNPTEAIDILAKMQQAKVALNSVMKYVDSQ